jgi:hypothetical protein
MQGYATQLEGRIAAEDGLVAMSVQVCRGDVAAGKRLAQGMMARAEAQGRKTREVVKSMALADSKVFEFLGHEKVGRL